MGKKEFSKEGKARKREEKEDALLVDHLREEVRRLYNEKVNFVNTNHVMTSQAFQSLTDILRRSVGDRKIENVEELVYAVDEVCNRKGEGSIERRAREEKMMGVYRSLKHVVGTLRAFAGEGEMQKGEEEKEREKEKEKKPEDLVNELIAELLRIRERVEGEMGRTSLGSLMARERGRSEALEGIRKEFNVGATVPLAVMVEEIKKAREEDLKRMRLELREKEKSMEYQKKYYEEEIRMLRVKMVDMEIDASRVRNVLRERTEVNEEIKRRSEGLDEGIRSIRDALVRESKRNEREKMEFEEVKLTLIQRNEELSNVVKELVKRIKEEKRDVEALTEVGG